MCFVGKWYSLWNQNICICYQSLNCYKYHTLHLLFWLMKDNKFHFLWHGNICIIVFLCFHLRNILNCTSIKQLTITLEEEEVNIIYVPQFLSSYPKENKTKKTFISSWVSIKIIIKAFCSLRINHWKINLLLYTLVIQCYIAQIWFYWQLDSYLFCSANPLKIIECYIINQQYVYLSKNEKFWLIAYLNKVLNDNTTCSNVSKEGIHTNSQT
jgi:hypothetical protein